MSSSEAHADEPVFRGNVTSRNVSERACSLSTPYAEVARLLYRSTQLLLQPPLRILVSHDSHVGWHTSFFVRPSHWPSRAGPMQRVTSVMCAQATVVCSSDCVKRLCALVRQTSHRMDACYLDLRIQQKRGVVSDRWRDWGGSALRVTGPGRLRRQTVSEAK